MNIKAYFKKLEESEHYSKKDLIDKLINILNEANDSGVLKNKKISFEELNVYNKSGSDFTPKNKEYIDAHNWENLSAANYF